MKKGIIAAILMMMLLTGCSIPTVKGNMEKQEMSFCNTYDLIPDQVYVWKDKGYGDLRKDLSPERMGREVFYKAPSGTISFAGKETEKESNIPRHIWFDGEDDKLIPTVTRNDALLYVSQTEVPKEIIYERFADNGYSIGIAGMQEDKGGHFYIPYAESRKDDYKYYIDPKSGAAALGGFEGIERLYLDKAGDMSVSENTVSDGGVVTQLLKSKQYDCSFYTGTFYQDFSLTADVRTFTSLEWFEGYEYEFLHANCIRLYIPEYFKSGYYMVLGKGLIRYVAPEDEAIYNGKETDDAIDWNDMIRRYDENGLCIYDPSDGTGMEDLSDPGISEEELKEDGGSDESNPDPPETREDEKDATVF
ncbi:MAG: hypothetical protein IK078_04580 [Lachnospiraceae bacterium]|nr:hypothetical protein [Lachnospiraceae bacterium]